MEQEFWRVTQLMEERGAGRGAMLLGQEAFADNYRFIMRFVRRNRMSVCRMMFVLEGTKKDGLAAKDTDLFGEILQNSLRKYDIIFRNRPNCYYLVLPGLAEKNVPVVKSRILRAWEDAEHHEPLNIQSIENPMNCSEE